MLHVARSDKDGNLQMRSRVEAYRPLGQLRSPLLPSSGDGKNACEHPTSGELSGHFPSRRSESGSVEFFFPRLYLLQQLTHSLSEVSNRPRDPQSGNSYTIPQENPWYPNARNHRTSVSTVRYPPANTRPGFSPPRASTPYAPCRATLRRIDRMVHRVHGHGGRG